MFNVFKNLLDTNQKEIDRLTKIVARINSLEEQAQQLKSADFPARINSFKSRLSKGESLDDLLPEVFALVREASVRTLKMRPFDVQLMAAIAFHEGKVAEQKTGEGKTLSAAPALVLNALTGKGAHLVTVNDYLARRDAGWMGPLYHYLGLTVGVIYSGSGDLPAAIYDQEYKDPVHKDERLQHLKPCPRPEAYQADITYGTNNEFGFDYLRDNMAQSLSSMTQRGHHFTIVDEVDSILIDEARTPLIISAPDTEPTDKYYRFARLINTLSADTDYEIDEKLRTANLTELGLKKLERDLNIDNIYEKEFDTVHHVEQALKARTLFEKDRDYIVKDGEIIIVDEHTGRLMYGRRYSDGLHQAIEAKEGVTIQQESKTLATISLQNYFRMYQKLAGMTGTAATEADEFKKIYNLDVVVIPTNRPVARQDYPDLVFKTTRAKYAAILADVEQRHHQGQPILIGTKSIEQNEVISSLFKRKKIPHQVLNAKNHENEAAIIAQAGAVGAVTIATNIAGRGVDIVLGGSPDDLKPDQWQKQHDQVLKSGGLHVIGAVRHESRRIDNQLRGRSGRQGDPGSSRFYVSLEDDIMRIFGGEQVSRLMEILKVPEDQPLEAGMVSKAIETAQSKVESFYFDQRKNVVEYDDVMNRQREIIYSRRLKILEDSEKQPESLRNRLQAILDAQIDQLTGILAPEGITEDETNTLLQSFQSLIPLDSTSQQQLKSYISSTTNPDEINTRLKKIISDAYKDRITKLGDGMMTQIEKLVSLTTIDQLWMQHLDDLTDLRDGIGLRGYAQKDPLVEYKHEAFVMFETLLSRIDLQIAQRLFRVQVRQQPPPDFTRQAIAHKADAPDATSTAPSKPKSTSTSSSPQKLGRNDPCWCGSGKKFKKCHYPQIS